MSAEIYDGCHPKIMWIHFISITIWFVSSAGTSRTSWYERWLWIQRREGKALSPCSDLKQFYLVFLLSANGPYQEPWANIASVVCSVLSQGSARSSHSDLMCWMNMYKTGHVILLMVIGLMPAWSQKQMVVTLRSRRCWDRLLLNMTATINTIILYCEE